MAFGARGAHDAFAAERTRMVARQIAARGVKDARVLDALARVPRHRFIDAELLDEAYEDHPVPIGEGQTISQPYIVGYMIEALELPDEGRVLEIGTGRGYEAAVLAAAGFDVFTIEIRPGLATQAEVLLHELGFDRVQVRCGDGAAGWPEAAPFDGIIVAAAAQRVPAALFDQLAPDGALVIPVGDEIQELWRYRRTPSGFQGEQLLSVRFVPLTGGGR